MENYRVECILIFVIFFECFLEINRILRINNGGINMEVWVSLFVFIMEGE